MSRHPCLGRPKCTACHPELEEKAVICAAVSDDSEERNHEENTEDMLGWTVEDVREAQRRDPEIGFIMGLMEKDSRKPDWGVVESKSSVVKSIWHEWERLVMVEGLLFRRWTGLSGEPDRRQVLFP